MSGIWPRRGHHGRSDPRPVTPPDDRGPDHGIPLLRNVTLECTGARLIQSLETLVIRWTAGGELVLPMTRCERAEILRTGEPGTLQFSCRFSLPLGDPERTDVVSFRLSVSSEYEDLAHEIVWRLRDLGPAQRAADPQVPPPPGDLPEAATTYAHADRSSAFGEVAVASGAPEDGRPPGPREPEAPADPLQVPGTFGASLDAWAPTETRRPGVSPRTAEEAPPLPLPRKDAVYGTGTVAYESGRSGNAGGAENEDPPCVVTVPDTDEWITFRPSAETERLAGRLSRRVASSPARGLDTR